MKSNIIILAFLLIWSCTDVLAQELRASVTINTPNLNLVDPSVFKTLENDLRDFINERKWTGDKYRPEERIECSFLLTIVEEIGVDRFKAHLTIQSGRPVYQSNYQTPLLNHVDKTLDFQYVQYAPLEFNENAYLSELTSFIAYYCYLILGLDYDSFAPEGGNPYFLKAQTLVNNAQNNPKALSSGWDSFSGIRNRFWLVDNILNSKNINLRKALYEYHRLGLDRMYEDNRTGADAVNKALSKIQKVYNSQPNLMVIDVLMNTKSDELVGIFASTEIATSTKNRAYNALVAIDPVNVSKYEKIKKSNTIGAGRSGGKGQLPTGSKSRFSGTKNSGGPAKLRGN